MTGRIREAGETVRGEELAGGRTKEAPSWAHRWNAYR
jgi:hypothetical protein